MNTQKFLQSEIGRYVTARLYHGDTIQDIIADFDNATLETEELLAESLTRHCTPEEIERYIESDTLYERTDYGRYLQSCIQYLRDHADSIASQV